MGKYLLENIHQAYPDARCGIVVGSRGSMIRDLLADYPWIEVIEANRKSPKALLTLIRTYWRSDLVTTLYTGGKLNLSTKLVARLLAKRGSLVGFTDTSPANRFLFDITLPTHGRDGVPRLHELAVLTAMHIPVGITWMRYSYIPQRELLPRLQLTEKTYVVVGLFSGADARGLSPKRKQDLIEALARSFPNHKLVFTGTPTERAKLAELHVPPTAVIAETTVQEAAALIAASVGMVSLGTGTSHIAALLHVPLVVMVACQGRQWVGPEQFGDAPVRVFSNPSACPPEGHDYSGYAPCINTIDMDTLSKSAQQLFLSTETPSV